MRYHMRLLEWPFTKTRENKPQHRCREKETLEKVSVGLQIGTPSVENSMEDPQKLKIELPYEPAILLLELYPKEIKTLT